MTDFPDTSDSLLVQVQDPLNQQAWDQFVLLYRPVIFRLACQKGLQAADAQDLAQQVLMSVAAAIGRWEKANESVRFRHWLRRVIRNAIVNALTRQPQDAGVGGTSLHNLLNEQPDPDWESYHQIDIEYRRQLYLKAVETVQTDVLPETWQAFELTVIQGMSIEATANQLGKSVGTIYASRSRIMRRLRDAVQDLEQLES